MKVLKRNQVILFLLAVMLVTAGYFSATSQMNVMPTSSVGKASDSTSNLSNTTETLGDATLVNGGAVVDNDSENIIDNTENTVETAQQKEISTYFSESKLQRDTMYSQTLDSYQKMLDSTTISSEQKAIAQQEITRINDEKKAIMIAENLIKTKGFQDIVVFQNGDSVNAIVRADKLSQEEIAQVQNILARELNAAISNIHISNK